MPLFALRVTAAATRISLAKDRAVRARLIRSRMFLARFRAMSALRAPPAALVLQAARHLLSRRRAKPDSSWRRPAAAAVACTVLRDIFLKVMPLFALRVTAAATRISLDNDLALHARFTRSQMFLARFRAMSVLRAPPAALVLQAAQHLLRCRHAELGSTW